MRSMNHLQCAIHQHDTRNDSTVSRKVFFSAEMKPIGVGPGFCVSVEPSSGWRWVRIESGLWALARPPVTAPDVACFSPSEGLRDTNRKHPPKQ